MSAPARLTIDIWSDVMCPWCIIGYRQLVRALGELSGEIEAEVRWHPFELNRDMAAEGEDIAYHLKRKYGREPDPAMTRQMEAMAARAGYDMRYLGAGEEPSRRIWNTFLAHKLLAWTLAEHGGKAQTRLKLALFDAHFQQRRNVSDPQVLLDIAESAGLDRTGAEAALANEALGDLVRQEEEQAFAMGINSVPMMLVNRRAMIPGAQDAAVYVDALRQVAERA